MLLFFFIILFLPIKIENNNLFLNFLFLIFIFGLPLFTLFWRSFFSLNKFSLISSKRFISQILSYEIGLIIIFIFFFPLLIKFNIELIIINLKNFFFLKLFLSLILFIIILIERSRIPFDFVEGESELVSGFNIEYSRSYFSLFFIYEYGIILYFSILLRYFLIFFFFFFILIYLFIHIRSSFPRLRYDQIINIIWKYIYSLLISILILTKF